MIKKHLGQFYILAKVIFVLLICYLVYDYTNTKNNLNTITQQNAGLRNAITLIEQRVEANATNLATLHATNNNTNRDFYQSLESIEALRRAIAELRLSTGSQSRSDKEPVSLEYVELELNKIIIDYNNNVMCHTGNRDKCANSPLFHF